MVAFQTLLELGASPNYKDSCGLTPLYHTAVVGGDPFCCELLLHEHATVSCKDENGWQEIHQVGKVTCCWELGNVLCLFYILKAIWIYVVHAWASMELLPFSVCLLLCVLLG